jgi:hypothetical protein
MHRKLSSQLMDTLKQHPLWLNKIKNDKEVFLTIRNERADFYHKGGLLFSFDKRGFKTHVKYAAVSTSQKQEYITESSLSKYNVVSEFEPIYDRIKENCAKFSGIESYGVSSLYHSHSYFSNNNIVVLDIEISFHSNSFEHNHDRIDILLFDKESQKLKFVEAKHYSNSEIWAKDSSPKVIGQLKRYNEQVAKKTPEILSAYNGYIECINELTDVSLPTPLKVGTDIMLLIFGFDIDQKNGRLKNLIMKSEQYSDVVKHAIGDIKKVNTQALWNSCK